MTEYTPKHMVDKEAVLAKWQASSAQAAMMLKMEGDLHGMDGDTWALLTCLGSSRELNELLYDYGRKEDPTHRPKHLKPPPPPPDPRTICGCGDFKPKGAFGCGPSGCINRPA